MGMPRLRHVPILLVPAALNAVACAMSKAPAPAEPPSAADATQARSYGQQAGYAEDMRAQSPAATAAPGQYPAPGAGSWPPFEEPPAADLPGLQAQLDRAEQALGLALSIRSSPGGDAAGVSQKAPAATATAPAPAAPATQADPCLIACAALASMRRSADHVCGMAGEKDAVCGGARERVQRAEQRVLQSCPACSSK